MAQTQVDFLGEYIVQLLQENDMKLSEEQMNFYVPQLLSQLEQRIGIELLPTLDTEKMDAFSQLLDRPAATTEEWQEFWYMAVPNFDEKIKMILLSFAEDVKRLLAK
ncbi:MAG: hypothetical protein COU35_01615 [Candidatus Magasanikbacteria bacterium CG10_big_fil_rev_8_21_14_0_10_47_10]|uniref:Uncharacterized protein n=1 Tax=Candidatus Magasanikbacteria bacterium CG10_big_fil_rev_8_21_14_0_10_47_10 TaxID=1974652 RepID=A0A2H0TQZ4_9BACT|nr:MAG: hypothetical protein COU35_01615 [Candidatus Magasanikbacteria bacterium CG10_big_fil_rev_8_21_14_0_10_47_10]